MSQRMGRRREEESRKRERKAEDGRRYRTSEVYMALCWEFSSVAE